MLSEIIAGDTLDFETRVDDYPSSAWTLKYRLTPISGTGTAIEFSAATEDDHYRTQIGPGVTAAWEVGDYNWSAWVTPTAVPGSARYVVDKGTCRIDPDPELMAAGTDTRTQAEKAVADLKLAYATFTATQGAVAEYEIAGRRMRFASAADILQRMSFWRNELNAENAAKAVALGLADPRRIYLRMGRA